MLLNQVAKVVKEIKVCCIFKKRVNLQNFTLFHELSYSLRTFYLVNINVIGAIMVNMWDIKTGKQGGWSLANFFGTYAYLCYRKIRGNGLVYKTKGF